MCPENLSEAEIKGSGLIYWVAEISSRIMFRLSWLQLTVLIQCERGTVKQKCVKRMSTLRGKWCELVSKQKKVVLEAAVIVKRLASLKRNQVLSALGQWRGRLKKRI